MSENKGDSFSFGEVKQDNRGGQGAIVNTGEMNQTINSGDGQANLFELMRAELEGMEPEQVGSMEMPDLAPIQSAIEEAAAIEVDLIEPAPTDVQAVESMTPLGFVETFETESSKPEEEQNKGLLSALVGKAKKFAPLVAKGALAAGEAYLKSTIKTSPYVAAALAAVAIVKGE